MRNEITGTSKDVPQYAYVDVSSVWMRKWMLLNKHHIHASSHEVLEVFSINHFVKKRGGIVSSVWIDPCIYILKKFTILRFNGSVHTNACKNVLMDPFSLMPVEVLSPLWYAVFHASSRLPTDKMFCHIHWIGIYKVSRQYEFSCEYEVSQFLWNLFRNL